MYSKQDLAEVRAKYQVSYDIVTQRLENPTYKNGVRRDRMSYMHTLTTDHVRLVLRKDIALEASALGLEPIETMMRVRNYAKERHINVSDRNRAELFGVVKALATPVAELSNVQQIMTLRSALPNTD
jgi:hypothetical protein